MIDSKPCVCSGIRSCLLCQPSKQIEDNLCFTDYLFCIDCGDKAFLRQFKDHSIHKTIELLDEKDFIEIRGVYLKCDVIDSNQELDLIRNIDSIEWFGSQSGRRKQDFGPKVNFKKRKLNFKYFNGLPDFDIRLLTHITHMSTQLPHQQILKDFTAVEVCHLEYSPSNGSSIDPHFDDFWLWGPRLVTVNLLSSTVINLIRPEVVGQSSPTHRQTQYRIRVPLPERSLIVLSSDSRYKYHHSIERQDIHNRRIAITYRELSEDFLPEGPHYEKWGKEIISRSMNELKLSLV